MPKSICRCCGPWPSLGPGRCGHESTLSQSGRCLRPGESPPSGLCARVGRISAGKSGPTRSTTAPLRTLDQPVGVELGAGVPARKLAAVGTTPCWGAGRQLALFWPAFERRTKIPPAGLFGPAYRRVPVHIYTPKEIAALLRAAQQLPPPESLRPLTFSTLLGLLACTGLRISEALQLDWADWEPAEAVLTIRQAKF